MKECMAFTGLAGRLISASRLGIPGLHRWFRLFVATNLLIPTLTTASCASEHVTL